MKIIGIIPARLASTRFPGKPLAKIHGRSMIEHVYRRAQCANLIDELYVATCDEEIISETERFGGKAIMTSTAHTRGSDRVAEAAEMVEADIILNIQGDEPLVDPVSLDEALFLMKNNDHIQCVNLIAPITDWRLFVDYNVVKAVIGQNNKILYFSRQPIPASAPDSLTDAFKQLGVCVFQKDFLLEFSGWEETPLEKLEKVDMLRILEHGFSIEAFLTKDMIGVDTPEDLSLVEQILLKDKGQNR